MPLNQESEQILAARKASGIPPTHRLTPQEVRASREAWRAQNAGPLPPVHAVWDETIQSHGGSFLIRITRPDATENLPLIVFYHGGGWVIGDIDHSDALCRDLCRTTRSVVINVDYRLAPEHKFPTAAEDAYAAVLWAAANAHTIGARADQIAVAGASAGGNLAAAVTLMARDRRGPKVAAQILAYPVLDADCVLPSYGEHQDNLILSAADMVWYWRQYLTTPTEADNPIACPMRAANFEKLPPAFILTAENDPVRDDGETYAGRLEAAGIPVQLIRYPGTLHGFLASGGPSGREAITDIAQYLQTALA